MLRVTLDNIAQQRTIRPLYAHTQATPWAGFLDPDWNRSSDILPGTAMTRLHDEVFAPVTSDDQEIFGLSALFVAPTLGIDEIRDMGSNNFAVWTGNADSAFEVLAPAFDTTATWTTPEDGSEVLLHVTLTGHAEGPGKLTVGTGANVGTKVAGRLISVVGSNKIIVSLDRKANATSAASGA